MGTKRPLTDVEESPCPPHKLIKSNPKQSNPQQSNPKQCSDCPICLESCHDPNQCFALDCCNRSLANDSPRQMCHKTCFFSASRHTLESAVKNGERLMRMTDERFQSMFRCPRCRASLPFQRSLSIEKQSLVFQYEWIDGTPIAQATFDLINDNAVSTEKVLFFSTIIGRVKDPDTALRSNDVKRPHIYRFARGGKSYTVGSIEPNKPGLNARQRLLGVQTS